MPEHVKDVSNYSSICNYIRFKKVMEGQLLRDDEISSLWIGIGTYKTGKICLIVDKIQIHNKNLPGFDAVALRLMRALIARSQQDQIEICFKQVYNIKIIKHLRTLKGVLETGQVAGWRNFYWRP